LIDQNRGTTINKTNYFIKRKGNRERRKKKRLKREINGRKQKRSSSKKQRGSLSEY